MNKASLTKILSGYLPCTFNQEEINCTTYSYLTKDDIDGLHGISPKRHKGIFGIVALLDIISGRDCFKPILDLKSLDQISKDEAIDLLCFIYEEVDRNQIKWIENDKVLMYGDIQIDFYEEHFDVWSIGENGNGDDNYNLSFEASNSMREYLQSKSFDLKQPLGNNLTLKKLGLAKY